MDAPSEASSLTAGWFPVVTLLLGFALNALLESLRRRHELKRDRESRRETRRDQLAEQRRNFQRETLLALQEAVMDLMRATGAAHHHDEMEYRRTGEWHKTKYTEELDQAHMIAMGRTGMLGVRVRDDELRNLVSSFRDCSAGEAVSGSPELGRAALDEMATFFDKIQQQIGQLLRTLDEETNLS